MSNRITIYCPYCDAAHHVHLSDAVMTNLIRECDACQKPFAQYAERQWRVGVFKLEEVKVYTSEPS